MAPIWAGIDCSVALTLSGTRPGLLNGFFLSPWCEERPPLIGNRDRLSFMRHGYIHDRRITDHGVALISYFLSHDEAGVSDGRESRPDAEIIARERLRLIRRLDLSHHRPQARFHILVVRHMALERRPPRPLQQRQHVGMIDVPHRVAVAWIDVNLEVFGHRIVE